MDIAITFPGGKRVDAEVGGRVISTDQPVSLGGQDSAPAPLDLLVAAVGTCAGLYALGYCQARGIPITGLAAVVHVEEDEASHLPARFQIALTLPDGFPERHIPAILRSVEHCKVKKAIAAGPTFEVVVAGPVTA